MIFNQSAFSHKVIFKVVLVGNPASKSLNIEIMIPDRITRGNVALSASPAKIISEKEKIMNNEFGLSQGTVLSHEKLKHWEKPTIINLNMQETKHFSPGALNDATTTNGLLPS